MRFKKTSIKLDFYEPLLFIKTFRDITRTVKSLNKLCLFLNSSKGIFALPYMAIFVLFQSNMICAYSTETTQTSENAFESRNLQNTRPDLMQPRADTWLNVCRREIYNNEKISQFQSTELHKTSIWTLYETLYTFCKTEIQRFNSKMHFFDPLKIFPKKKSAPNEPCWNKFCMTKMHCMSSKNIALFTHWTHLEVCCDHSE